MLVKLVVDNKKLPCQVTMAIFKKLIDMFLGYSSIIEANSDFLLI